MGLLPALLTTSLGPLPAGVVLGLLVCLVLTAPGFARVVYFISTGYGFSIAALALVAAVVHRAALEPLVVSQLFLLAAHGLRLGVFLVWRERAPSYRAQLDDIARRSAHITRPVQVAIWLSVSLLYVVMAYPAFTTLAARAGGDTRVGALPVGVALMAIGLLIEHVGDRQKSRFKRDHPDRFCDVGLYRVVRYPSYFGEMVFWLGQLVAGVAHFSHWSHWLLSGVGFVCIQLIMIGSTRRLELQQAARYGADPAFVAWTQSVPVLFPWVPIFTMKNARVYLG